MNISDSKVRLLFLNQFSSWGGGEQALFTIIKKLDRSRFEIRVMLPSPGPLADRLQEIGIQCDYSRQNNYIKANRIQLIYVNSPRMLGWGVLAAKLNKIPVIWHVHTVLDGIIKRALGWLASKMVDHVIADSKVAGSVLGSLGTKLQIIPNGVDLEKFERPPASPKTRTFPLIGSLGRLVSLKGYEDLIQAAPIILGKFPAAKFAVAGEALYGTINYKYQLEALIKQLDLSDNFHFIGPIENTVKFLSVLDILVSCSRSEGFGFTIVEAMAAGIPIAATNIPAFKEILGEEAEDIMYTPGDHRGLAATIIKQLTDEDLRLSLIKKHSRIVQENYDEKKQVKKIEALLCPLLARS